MAKEFKKGQRIKVIDGHYKGAIGTVERKHYIFFKEGSYIVKIMWEGEKIVTDCQANQLEELEVENG